MPLFRSLVKELALIDVELAILEIPTFHGKKDKFTFWFLNVEQVFTCYNLDGQEKFKVVISSLRGCALQWWDNYKFKRRKKRKEKMRTWEKLRSKLMGAFCPPSHMLKHASLLPKKSGSKSSCMEIYFNKGCAKSSCTFSPLPCCPWRKSSSVKLNR